MPRRSRGISARDLTRAFEAAAREKEQALEEFPDVVSWLKHHTRFDVADWPYEARFLLDNGVRTRVVRKSRQIGITTTACHEAVWKACTSKDRLILFVSPSDRQSKEPMKRMQRIVGANPKLYAMAPGKGDLSKSKSEIEFEIGRAHV